MTIPGSPLSLLPAANLPATGAERLVAVQAGADVLITIQDALAPFFKTLNGQCYLSLSGGNITLLPQNGNRLVVNGVSCTIPTAGLTLAATSLTVGTLYYIYATASNGVISTLEASTTGHSRDTTTGVETKTGDVTRTLVGMARPVTGPAWADSLTQRFVVSWFNRKAKPLFADSLTSSSSSSTMAAAATIGEFLTWNDAAIRVTCEGQGSNTTAAANWKTSIFVDSAQVLSSITDNSSTSANLAGHFNRTYTGLLSEGYHSFALGVAAGTNTSNYSYSQQGATFG